MHGWLQILGKRKMRREYFDNEGMRVAGFKKDE